jgi:peptide/nickel transport system substrate-binding protein
MNTKVEPFNDREIRRAVAYAIDRQKTIDLAYEGAVILQVIPFSSYGGLNPYRDAVKDIVAKYNPGEYNPSKTAEIMTRKGYRKGSDGFWVGPDGKKLTLNLDVPSWLNPLGPVVERQLQDAGFDVQFKLYAPDATPFFQSVRNGDSKLWIIVHCGSGREPWGTLQHFHSKWSAPIGQSTRYIWANSRYENPEYDRLIDQMDTIPPSPKDQKYMDLTRRAIEIYLRDLPQIYISDEMHVVTFNEYYWTGWAGGNDPYVAPYSLWAGFLLEILNLKPAR